MNNKDINPTDSNGDYHGYQLWYFSNGKIWLRGNRVHGNEIGYEEWHLAKRTNFFIR